jgi:hypothetical protein
MCGTSAISVVYLLTSVVLQIHYLSYALDPDYRPSGFLVTRAGELYDQIQILRGCVVIAGIVAGVVVVGLVAARTARRARVR